jgi:hypothetical protein
MYFAVAALIAGQGLLVGFLPLVIYALAFGLVAHLFSSFRQAVASRRASGAR